jgi:hypothetical protein
MKSLPACRAIAAVAISQRERNRARCRLLCARGTTW